MSININQVDKSEQTGKQTSEISGDGKTGVATQLIAPHGMAYRPKAGSLAISLAVGGDPSNTASIAPQGDIALDLAVSIHAPVWGATNQRLKRRG